MPGTRRTGRGAPVILDTQFLGALVEQEDAALAKATALDEGAVPRRLPTTVVWELFYGIGNVADDDRADTLRTALERLFKLLTILEADDPTARRAGLLRGSHARSDRPAELDGADSFVAAHGLLHDEPVVSNDETSRT